MNGERIAFENWLGIKPCGAAHDLAWAAWKARASLPAPQQATPEPVVPGFIRIARRKLDSLQADGWQINGYAVRRGDGRGFVDASGFVGWWRGEHDARVPDPVAMFDAAVEQELPLVSHVQYDSHEICKHFAANVRKALAASQQKGWQ